MNQEASDGGFCDVEMKPKRKQVVDSARGKKQRDRKDWCLFALAEARTGSSCCHRQWCLALAQLQQPQRVNQRWFAGVLASEQPKICFVPPLRKPIARLARQDARSAEAEMGGSDNDNA